MNLQLPLIIFVLAALLPFLSHAQGGVTPEDKGTNIYYIIDGADTQNIKAPPVSGEEPAQQVITDVPPAVKDSNEVHTLVEQMPKFAGGEEGLSRYLASIEYPEKSRKELIGGSVFVEFVVERDGAVSNFKVLRGVNEELDAAAVAHLQKMPRWEKPGMQHGKPVRVKYIVPVRFVPE